MRWLLFLFLLVGGPSTLAESVDLPTIDIEDNQEDKKAVVDPFSIYKVERVSRDKITSPSRQNLSEIVQDQVGVDSQVYCANCGAKRLTINGLKGEHTSILIDGLPMHSAVSSFYGVDNIPALGLEEILVMRGAGASLTNPEAIGGTLNLITVNPLDANNQYQSSIGIDDQFFGKSQNHSLLYGLRSANKKFGVTIGGQFARNEAWDTDRNDVSESPQRETLSLLAKSRWLLGNSSDISARVGYSQLEILGGFFRPTRPSQVRPVPAQETDFVNGSVEQDFIGDPSRITDWIAIDRLEGALTGQHQLANSLTYNWKIGYARQAQNAIYQHGFDYANVDNMFVGDTNLQWSVGSSSLIKVGTFFKDQRLRSASQQLFEIGPLRKDNFDHSSYALYGQWSYFVSEVIEMDLALRADHLTVDWRELTNRVETTVLAPRFQVLHHLTHDLTQRFSYGLGYRAPLTFFESQHGNNEGGYEVDITDLERAHSLVYSLSLNTPNYYVTGGVHFTHLENMAYGFETAGGPTFYRNTSESYDIWLSDLLVGFKPYSWWLLEASYELFQYEDGYKEKLPTATIEQRVQLKSNIEKGDWTHSLLVNIIGSRDLSKYGSYSDHFVDRDQLNEGSLTPPAGLELKNQNSPTFFTVDTSVSYQLYPELVFSFAINNMFNFTQASYGGDTPATWHWHFIHAHFDGLHTWGPNIGRQYLFTVSGSF